MVVRVAVATGWRARRDYRSLLRATVVLAGIAVLPTLTQSAGLPPTAQSHLAPDSATPTVSSIVSTAGLSSTFSVGGVGSLPQTLGSDSTTWTELEGILQQGVPPGSGSAEVDGFGVDGSGGAEVATGGVVAGLNGGVPTISGAGGLATISTAEGIQPLCGDSQMTEQLQASGQFWNAQAVSATPVQFPQGTFTGIDLQNPLGDLGPSGNPSNLSPQGPGGGWCRPPPGPFSQSSPLESRLVWVGTVSALVGVLVFWLSRGMKMPTRRGQLAAG